MKLERIALVVSIFLFCLTTFFTMRALSGTTDPASSMAGFFLFRAHCPIPESEQDDLAATMGNLHLFQSTFPF